MSMDDAERIGSVTDHGMWRGNRTWTVCVDGPTGPAKVSVIDEPTEAKAIEQALKTYREQRVFSDEERAAMQRANTALRKGLR